MMSAEMISASAGILLSLVFAYIPGLSNWYKALDGTYKRLVMLAALALVVGGMMGLSCLGVSLPGGVKPACSQAGLLEMLEAFIAALIANQAAYLISPK
jgi:hypothetical protein